MKNIHINNRNGFTLIELLVVISIIALLVSIVMPSLGTARQLAQKAACMATLKGIGQAWNMYLDANDRKWPTEDAEKGFIVEAPESYREGEFYIGSEKVYTINEAMKDFFPINGWKCSSNDGKEEFDTRGSSYEFYPALILEISSAGFTYNGVTINTDAVVRACDEAAASAPIVTDVMSDSGPHRLNPSEESSAGYVVVYQDSHVETSSSDTLEQNMTAIATALLGAQAAEGITE